ncbi:MAG: GxxExxY protein [Kiritimatiellales bacterium]
MELEQLTEKIIGCAYTVYKKLGCGFLESVYEKSLLIELENAGLRAQSQVPVDVRYDGQCVGSFFADLLVEESVIIELKSVTKIIAVHEVQLVNYLTATGKPVGLILNFSPTGVEVKRKVRSLNSNPVDPVNPV